MHMCMCMHMYMHMHMHMHMHMPRRWGRHGLGKGAQDGGRDRGRGSAGVKAGVRARAIVRELTQALLSVLVAQIGRLKRPLLPAKHGVRAGEGFFLGTRCGGVSRRGPLPLGWCGASCGSRPSGKGPRKDPRCGPRNDLLSRRGGRRRCYAIVCRAGSSYLLLGHRLASSTGRWARWERCRCGPFVRQ
jgi:hypothetical protein